MRHAISRTRLRCALAGPGSRTGEGRPLMQVPKPRDGDKEFFRSLIPDDDPRVEVKPMFGNLGAFVNGNMFAGLFGSSVGVKVGPDDTAELAAAPGAGPFGPAERPMSGYMS